MPPESLVFVDESGIDSYISRTAGRAKKGQKVKGEKSGKRYARHSFVAAKCGKKILAPMTYKGTCNSQLFEKWVEKVLLPEIKQGQIIIMDNATFHKSLNTKLLIESAGCQLLFLPPYSPDFNPIEKFWAWFKRQIREIINTFTSLEHAINYVFNSCNS
jgi:transposase